LINLIIIFKIWVALKSVLGWVNGSLQKQVHQSKYNEQVNKERRRSMNATPTRPVARSPEWSQTKTGKNARWSMDRLKWYIRRNNSNRQGNENQRKQINDWLIDRAWNIFNIIVLKIKGFCFLYFISMICTTWYTLIIIIKIQTIMLYTS
jgi:hypothetical protein